jgi:hypothetical protein
VGKQKPIECGQQTLVPVLELVNFIRVETLPRFLSYNSHWVRSRQPPRQQMVVVRKQKLDGSHGVETQILDELRGDTYVEINIEEFPSIFSRGVTKDCFQTSPDESPTLQVKKPEKREREGQHFCKPDGKRKIWDLFD